jgi:hypothetical protein
VQEFSQKSKCVKFVEELLTTNANKIESVKEENDGKLTLTFSVTYKEDDSVNVKLSFAAKHSDSRDG